jgi:ubiquinone/menaquinone biosynthesis C-methylase UbiE
MLDEQLIALLRCPVSGQPLHIRDGQLETADGARSYPISPEGIPLLAPNDLGDDARTQQAHYDSVAEGYIANLDLPHTRTYTAYLDRLLINALADEPLGTTLDLCCGRGEGTALFGTHAERILGLDISTHMLTAGAAQAAGACPISFLQGDATRLPLKDATCDTVVTLGGIHHINDRAKLFNEVNRVLKPGGRFIWREPLDDFVVWRWLRAVIYRLSPALDEDTERPLRRGESFMHLHDADFMVEHWQPCGFIGFCLFMNSDVLKFNTSFRHVPGIEAIVRATASLDDVLGHIPGVRNAGLQVIGVARKPMS